MEFNTGTYIAIAAALFFYLRLIIIQRQKVKKQQSAPAAKPGKKSKKSTGPAASSNQAGSKASPLTLRPTLVISNPILVGLGVVLILLGAAAAFTTSLDPAIRDAWWLPVTAGIILMSLGIR